MGFSDPPHPDTEQSSFSLSPCSRDVEELRELVDTVITEVGPRKFSTARGVESYYQPGLVATGESYRFVRCVGLTSG